MAKYSVQWTKTYHASGIVEVDAPNADDAHDLVCDQIGDYEVNNLWLESNEITVLHNHPLRS